MADEFFAAQRGHTTVQVMVSAAGFDAQSRSADPRRPIALAFTGLYNGHMRTVARPQAADGAGDTGPCPPQPDDPPHLNRLSSGRVTEYCVPLLESRTLQKQ